MSEPMYTLRPDVIIEPLVARWHAWTHLISPVTAALNTAHRHLKIMKSYVSMPESHAAAVKDSALLGGPFVDLGGGRIDQIDQLINWTLDKQSYALQFAQDIGKTWQLLAEQADGHGLAPLYPQLPDTLKGVVELVYSPTGAADLRFIEPLLYRSPAYDPSIQTTILRRIKSDQRSFALTTPRLDEPGTVHLERPFNDPVYDYLGKLRQQGQPLAQIMATVSPYLNDSSLFETFLQPVASSAPSADKSPPSATRWRYFGHACVLVETSGGQAVLIDPVIAYEGTDSPARYTLDDLPDFIDYVVLTHNHQDHVLFETLLAIRYKVGTVIVPTSGGSLADPSLKLALEAIGFANVIELNCLAQHQDRELTITALPFIGEHADLDIRCKAAWMVTVDGLRLVFAADSNNLDPMMYQRINEYIGRIDVLFLGMECRGAPMTWLYGPLLPQPVPRSVNQSRRLDGSDSARAIALLDTLAVDEVYVYAMGMEPWLKFISSLDPTPDSPQIVESNALLAYCAEKGIKAERLYGKAEYQFDDIVDLSF